MQLKLLNNRNPLVYTSHITLVILNPTCTYLAAKKNAVPTAIVTPQNICKYKNFPWSDETNAPPIGLPVKPATETKRNNVPFRTPISLIGEICATSAGTRETKAPDEKPYRAANTMMGALAADGSQRASTMMAEKLVVTIITLKRPNRSAIIPGRTRPKILGVLVEF